MRDEDRESLARLPERRVLWARRKWGDAVDRRAGLDHSLPEGADCLAVLATADPTDLGAYLSWICRTYAKGAFLLEDAERIRSTLELFHRWKHRLPPEARDVGRHRDEQSVWAAVEKFDPSREDDGAEEDATGREKKRRERARALAESEIAEPEGLDGWIAVSPRTHFAARWWSKGTRWCTGMESPYHFDHYTKSGPLRILIDPSGAKFQVHLATGSCTEASDRRHDLDGLIRSMPPAAVDFLRSDADAVKEKLLSDDGRADAHSFEDGALRLMRILPAAFIDEETREAVRRRGLSLVQTVFEEEGWRLRKVTKDVSKWALGLGGFSNWNFHQYGTNPSWLLLERPDGGRTDLKLDDSDADGMREFGRVAASAPPAVAEAIALDVARRFEGKNGYRTHAYITAFTSTFGEERMPKEGWVTIAKQLSKRTRDWYEFQIPEACVCDEVADALAGGFSILALPPSKRTKERFIKVLSKNPGAVATELPFLEPPCEIDEEIAFAVATAGNGNGMEFVPQRFVTKDFCIRVLEKAPRALKHVPHAFLDLDTCLSVMERCGGIVMDVPKPFRGDRRIWLKAVASCPGVISKAPDRLKDEELCMTALERDPTQFPHATVPLLYGTYLKAMEKGGSMLGRVPLEYRDAQMCLTALTKDRAAAAHVPPKVARILKESPEGADAVPAGRKLSSRYGSTHPIHSCEPPEVRPEKLPPLPAAPPPADRAGLSRERLLAA